VASHVKQPPSRPDPIKTQQQVRGTGRTSRILLALLLFNALSSVGGGIALMTGLIPEQAAWIQHTDFPSLYFPGVILMAVVGGSSLIAAIALARHSSGWELSAILAGTIMLIWIVGEVASIRGFHFLQVIYFATGALVLWYAPAPGAGLHRDG
jgi:hypothetical protein